MKVNKRSTHLFGLTALALVTAIIIYSTEQLFLYTILNEKSIVLSCGSPLISTDNSIQSKFSTLSERSGINIRMNYHNGYGSSGDRNSCPHQSTQSALWIGGDRKNKMHSC